eukprot:8362994-Alexandrium_andersonii.AAC.1
MKTSSEPGGQSLCGVGGGRWGPGWHSGSGWGPTVTQCGWRRGWGWRSGVGSHRGVGIVSRLACLA